MDSQKIRAMQWFIDAPAAIFIMMEYLPRQFHLNKMQNLNRNMYYNRVPTHYLHEYDNVFLHPNYKFEELFINMVRNIDF